MRLRKSKTGWGGIPPCSLRTTTSPITKGKFSGANLTTAATMEMIVSKRYAWKTWMKTRSRKYTVEAKGTKGLLRLLMSTGRTTSKCSESALRKLSMRR